jgi:hypothetical protein
VELSAGWAGFMRQKWPARQPRKVKGGLLCCVGLQRGRCRGGGRRSRGVMSMLRHPGCSAGSF